MMSPALMKRDAYRNLYLQNHFNLTSADCTPFVNIVETNSPLHILYQYCSRELKIYNKILLRQTVHYTFCINIVQGN